MPDDSPVTKSELKAELVVFRADLGHLHTARNERLAALEERITNVEKGMIEKRI